MSYRSLLEFNHDLFTQVEANPIGFIQALGTYLASGSNDPRLKDALRSFGIIVRAHYHHSDSPKIVSQQV